MKAKITNLILLLLALSMALASCDTAAKRQQQARTLYNNGVELREQRLSEEAALLATMRLFTTLILPPLRLAKRLLPSVLLRLMLASI